MAKNIYDQGCSILKNAFKKQPERFKGKIPQPPALTRKDPFGDVWDGMKLMLKINPGLEAKTLFDDLQRRQPGTLL